jgi:hypothetical protein
MIRSLLLSSALLAACPVVAQSSGLSAAVPDGQSSATAGPASAEKTPSAAMLRVRAANRAAIQEPQTHGFLSAMQVYPYREGVLYRLYAAPERVTDIALQPPAGSHHPCRSRYPPSMKNGAPVARRPVNIRPPARAGQRRLT